MTTTGSDRPLVAFDTGSLHGHQTGIGLAVGSTLAALRDDGRVAIAPYVLSLRSRPAAGVRKLPLPAALAHRWWSRSGLPVDRLLGSPDVVHGTNYVVPPATCARLVSVYDCWFLEHPDDATPDVRRAGAVLRRSVDHGAHVVTCSDATTQRVRTLLGTDRVTTVLLGPPTPPTSAAPSDSQEPDPQHRLGMLDDAPFVLSLGTVERRKNIPALVVAFGRLADEHETVRLVIAGAPGNDQAATEREIDALPTGVRDRVFRLGPVSADVKQRLLSSAAVLAYISLDEGFGFPLLEAQQARLPIVASSAGSIPEVAGAAALLSAPGDIAAVAANMHLAITSEAVRAKLISQSERNLERFAWSATARQLIDLYLTLANGPR